MSHNFLNVVYCITKEYMFFIPIVKGKKKTIYERIELLTIIIRLVFGVLNCHIPYNVYSKQWSEFAHKAESRTDFMILSVDNHSLNTINHLHVLSTSFKLLQIWSHLNFKLCVGWMRDAGTVSLIIYNLDVMWQVITHTQCGLQISWLLLC